MGKREAILAALMDDFYAGSGVDWRTALNGETIKLAPDLTSTEVSVRSLTFVADGIRQVAPPKPFDSKRCAWALKQAIKKEGA